MFFATEKPIAEILQLKSAEQLYAFVAELSGSFSVIYVTFQEFLQTKKVLNIFRKYLFKLTGNQHWFFHSFFFAHSNISIYGEIHLLRSENQQVATLQALLRYLLRLCIFRYYFPHKISSIFKPMETEENRTGLKISSATFPNKTASLSLTVPAEHSMEVSPPVVSTFVLDIEPIFRVTGHRTGDQTYKSPQVHFFFEFF